MLLRQVLPAGVAGRAATANNYKGYSGLAAV